MASTRFQIYLNPDQYQQLRRIAQEDNSSIAALIREAVQNYLQRRDSAWTTEEDSLWQILGIK